MGACDHPATNQPGRNRRFGSTLCYPDSGRFCFQYRKGSNEVEDDLRQVFNSNTEECNK
ncbi:hypothetical protein MFFC18_18450 [Mariniblastus fucicola]|uniref:Uncharacterized protein n=1 Tax=Mariniblastus fucicola TaxID=980251 RepID=A0A5B9P6S6_9BACT|nr:hypothetical protein MFFC18_18450 [Mariniblastus fucicola]